MQTVLRGLAVSNLLMFMISPWLLIRWPFPFSTVRSPADPQILLSTLPILFIFLFDYGWTIAFFRRVSHFSHVVLPSYYRILVWIYVIISLFIRIIVFFFATFFLAPFNGYISIILISINSILFASILNIIRKLPMAVNERGKIMVLIIFNLFTLVYVVAPIVTTPLSSNVLIYLIIFFIGGSFKSFSYLLGGILYYHWSNNLKDPESDDTYKQLANQALYPEER